MQRKALIANSTYELFYDEATKQVSLETGGSPCLTAQYFHDSSDGATLLSQFEYKTNEQKGLVKVTADLISEHLSHIKNGCKLLCIAGEFEQELQGNDYRATNIDRFMLRESNQTVSEKKKLEDIKIEKITAASASIAEKKQILNLLKQTYWAEGADPSYVQKALENSVFIVARQEDKIVGLGRYISNNNFAYISDMVVDAPLRKQGLGTAIMQMICKSIDEKHKLTALFFAREGDGLLAAPKLYGDKFGFEDYNSKHQQNIYFRYVKLAPQNVQQDIPKIVPQLAIWQKQPNEDVKSQVTTSQFVPKFT